MNLKSIKYLTTFDFCFIGLATVLWIYVYIGFFFPGSYMLFYGVNPKRILWFIRLVLPLLYLGFIILIIKIRMEHIGGSVIVLLLVAFSLSLYICYSIADGLYQEWFDSHRQEYHPYLQIMPNDDKRLDKKAPNAITVFCVGGSTTELPDSKGRDWPSRVETILRTTYGIHNVEVYNFGRQWYTSLHTLINFETNLRKHKPSVILIMQSINDVLQNADFSYFSHGVFRDDYGHFYGPVNRIIDRRSLWRYLRDVVSGLWYATPRKMLTTDRFPGLETYERNISTIIELAKHDSTEVVLMTEPYLIKKEMSKEEVSSIGMTKVEAINDTMVWSSETILNGMEQYNKALEGLAHQNDLLLIDLEKEVPKSLTYFRDEVHYQDTTFSVIAPFIANRLSTLFVPGNGKQ